MGTKKISELTELTEANENNIIPIVDTENEATKKIKVKNLGISINEYSTQERIIGKWINGKPLYRKVIEFSSTIPTGDTNIAHNISNIGFVLRYDLIGGEPYVFPYMDTAGKMTLIDQVTPTNVIIRNFTSADWYQTTHDLKIILEYTKTTD